MPRHRRPKPAQGKRATTVTMAALPMRQANKPGENRIVARSEYGRGRFFASKCIAGRENARGKLADTGAASKRSPIAMGVLLA